MQHRLSPSADGQRRRVSLALHVWLLAALAGANDLAVRGEGSRVVPVFMDELYGLWLPAREPSLRRLWTAVLDITAYQEKWEIEIKRLSSKEPTGREGAGYRRHVR